MPIAPLAIVGAAGSAPSVPPGTRNVTRGGPASAERNHRTGCTMEALPSTKGEKHPRPLGNSHLSSRYKATRMRMAILGAPATGLKNERG